MLYPYGNNLKLYIEGGSHDEKIEMFLDGFPAGFQIDADELLSFMQRRAPGRNEFSTSRKEGDVPEFLTGVENSVTQGGRIHAVIRNSNQHSSDYSQVKDIPRPSHADFAAISKYGADVDLRGGGHYSGRLTAMLCVAGGLCIQYLKKKGIEICAHVYSIADVKDAPFDAVNPDFSALSGKEYPVTDDEACERMKAKIAKAKSEGDSVGGIIECAVTGLEAGMGEHMFAGVEARIASALFAVPAVKGVEFGAGFASAGLRGSENNDPFVTDGKKVSTLTNNCGGILGGMTNSMPVVVRAAFKPTPSIAKEQQSVSLSKMENVTFSIKGRHDPCIVFRAVPVVEAVVALAVCDILSDGGDLR